MVDARMVTGTVEPRPNGATTTSETTPRKSLASKLAEVVLAVSHVAKRGHNDFHNYDYATEADVLEAVRKGLAERSVVIIPRCIGASIIERERLGKSPEYITTADLVFALLDGETGETLECPWKGSGADASDKGLYKAMTGGSKTFLLKLFMIPTGDDPEREKAPKKRTERDPAPSSSSGPPIAAPPDDAPPDVKAILAAAGEIQQHTGQSIPDIVKAFSQFTDKEGKVRYFTDPMKKLQSAGWLSSTRGRMEKEAHRLRATKEPGAAEAAEAFTDGLDTAPCGKKHGPADPCKDCDPLG